MFRTIVLAAGVVAGLAATGSARADAISDGIAAIPGAVEEVRIGGGWDNGDKRGVYRIVIARTGGDPVTARLFVQWVAFHNEDATTTVDDTIEIKELADLKLDVVDFTAESDQDGLAVYIQTLNPNSDGTHDESYELFVTSPTEYRFGPASN